LKDQPAKGAAERTETQGAKNIKVSPPNLPKRKVKALDKEGIEALLDAADHAICKRRARALVLFLLDTGARASEVAGDTLEHVTRTNGHVRVIGKGGKERYVYLGRKALYAPQLYVNKRD
jgi:site-specific recombinase XerD